MPQLKDTTHHQKWKVLHAETKIWHKQNKINSHLCTAEHQQRGKIKAIKEKDLTINK